VLREEKLDKLVLLKLSRPEKLNSLNSDLLRELSSSLKRLCEDEKTGLIAITGEGRLFSAGIDLEEVAKAGSPDEASRPFRGLAEAIDSILSCHKAVATILNGPAVAGGAELALSSDILIAVKGSWLQWPEISWNLVAPIFSSTLFSFPSPRLAYVALKPERIEVEEALRLGLISKVVRSLDEAIAEAKELAEHLSKNVEATRAYLSYVREPKRRALNALNDLIRLAESQELIARARKFMESKGR